MLTKGDFHIHSTASDGELSPEEIIVTAKRRGVDTIAITDHNTTDGIKEAAEAGKQHGVSVIPAVEISTRYNHESIHLLGYFKNASYNDSTFQEVLKLIRTHKVKKARDILGSFMPKESSEDGLSVFEGIYLLKTFGGAVVLAHPVRINKKYLAEILNMPFDGLEAKYCHNIYYKTLYFVSTALARFSFYTGGSDFHTNKRKDTKHCLIGDTYLNSEEIKMFLRKSGAALLS
ncbi:phosphatase [Clostridium polyendosporum]|uniref:Phosphatase n=1 Tax=Clostridium polyendosporum TaxID=69208 RepID=A0A919VFV8_9CLOT|nr:PHP domain-containing protein [Clostridium polyendosporum]GIM28562.1 phosphatase [Clostridium polyendosporum]